MKYEPMLAIKAGTELLNNKEYYFQPKIDGTRAIYINGKFTNRRDRDITYRYPEFKQLKIKKNCVIDGEITVYNTKGLPDFNLLQYREQAGNKTRIQELSNETPATYIVFDCLVYEGKDITNLPLTERMKYLKKAVTENEYLQVVFNTENGKALWNEVVKRKLEGVMAKKKTSTYSPGKRLPDWLKIKYLKTQDCIILGYTLGKKSRRDTFGALILGAYKDNKLIQVGKVGTGFDEQGLKKLKKEMDKLKTRQEDEKVYIKQKLVCEVEYLELSKNNQLRAPSYKGIRYDKTPKDAILGL